MSDEAKTREQLINELISLREELARLKDLDLAAQRLGCAERLATGIAHNFNNILTPILGYSQLGAKAQSADAILSKYFNEISLAADRANELTNMLLAFSGRQIRYPRLINLNAFILNMEPAIKEIVGDDVQLRLNLTRDSTLVKVDPKQIEQVLKNLASNSKDAMPNGGSLVIETAAAYLKDDNSGWWPNASAGDHVMVYVSDTGAGMTEKVQRHVFEPFFSTHEPWDHIGLGLSVCYGIISQNEGRINIRSKPGSGTAMTIYLPQATNSANRTSVDDEVEYVLKDSRTVLLVESDPSIAELACRALREHGYRVMTSLDADAALSDYGSASVNLVVTSIVKPSADQDGFASRLRKTYPLSRVAHVVDGASSMDVQAPRRFDPVALLRKVKEALRE